MALSQNALDALVRLQNTYNGDAYNETTNPGGLAEGGHRFNFPAALQDIATVLAEIPPEALAAAASALAAATSEAEAEAHAVTASAGANAATTAAADAVQALSDAGLPAAPDEGIFLRRGAGGYDAVTLTALVSLIVGGLSDGQISGAKIDTLDVAKLVGSIVAASVAATDGTAGAPSHSFAGDTDTGLYRPGDDQLAVALGGVKQVALKADHYKFGGSTAWNEALTSQHHLEIGDGAVLKGNMNNNGFLLNIGSFRDAADSTWKSKYGNPVGALGYSGSTNGVYGYWYIDAADPVAAGETVTNNRIVMISKYQGEYGGSLQLGNLSGLNPSVGNTLFVKASASQSNIARFATANGGNCFTAYDGNKTTSGVSGTATAIMIAKDAATGRSLNAPGTGNFSGADYAEYLKKSTACGVIEKGDICALNSDGELTRSWSEAISFRIKSTNPALVGGDDWFTEELIEKDDYNGNDYGAYKADFDARLEEARQQVDRIAYAGRVPLNNPQGNSFDVGDYIVPQPEGVGIDWKAVPEAEMTVQDSLRCIGQIEKVSEDGRPFVAVNV